MKFQPRIELDADFADEDNNAHHNDFGPPIAIHLKMRPVTVP